LACHADETELNATKRFKVSWERDQLPLVTVPEPLPNRTGMVMISGEGVVLALLVMWNSLQNLRDLADYNTDSYSATSTNGWMMNDIWAYGASR
jgi:hypothetical protein